MLERRIPSGFARLSEDLSGMPVLISELEMSRGENDNHTAGMIVHYRLLVRTIVDVHNLHPFILKGQLIVLRFDLGWILGHSGIESKTDNYHYPE
jgi:hypothetical protein